jgi:hypothetical protein
MFSIDSAIRAFLTVTECPNVGWFFCSSRHKLPSWYRGERLLESLLVERPTFSTCDLFSSIVLFSTVAARQQPGIKFFENEAPELALSLAEWVSWDVALSGPAGDGLLVKA